MRVSNEVYFSRQRVSFFSFNSFFFLCEKYRYLSMGDEVERTSPFQIYYIHLRVGGRGEKTSSFDLFFRLRSRAATTRGARREVQTPPLCEYRLPVESYHMIYFCLRPFEQISRALTHKVSNELRSFSGA